MTVRIIGGGLAGCEAAWQLASRGISVHLTEMRPKTSTKAHKTGSLAELVCSNSFRGADLSNAVGLLKEEMRMLGSLIMEAADATAVPAGGALAVDREQFSRYIELRVKYHPHIIVEEKEVIDVPLASREEPAIVATGPLTSPALAASIEKLSGEGNLAFFDAISPIVTLDSLNLTQMFRQSRYDKGGGSDYLNIPLTKDEYVSFVEAVDKGEKFGGHEEVESDSIDKLRPFEGCMPIEDMIVRGPETLRFGPLKPVGLTDPVTGRRPYAVIQLRQDDKEGRLWSLVGFQTRLKHGEQQRIFRSLPGMKDAEFVRLGSVHRNSFMNSPQCLDATLQYRSRPGLFFAGQITGVEGYVESSSGGLVAGINVAQICLGREPLIFPVNTALGALMHYISDPSRKQFQPMNISFGLIPSYVELHAAGKKKESKALKRKIMAEASLRSLGEFISTHRLNVRDEQSWLTA